MMVLAGWWMGMATAADVAVLVLPSNGAPEEATLAELLRNHEFEVEDVRDARTFVRDLRVVAAPEDLDAECASSFELRELDARLASAKKKFHTLNLSGALADYASLELDLACAVEPVEAGLVFGLDLARAEVSFALSSTSMTEDPERAAFFAQEAASALDRAVVVGEGLAIPREADKTIRAALAAAKTRQGEVLLPRVALAAPAGVEFYLNGNFLTNEGGFGVVGENLVVLARGGEVVGSARISARAEEMVVLDGFGRFDEESPLAVLEGLVRGPPDAEESMFLVAMASVTEAPTAVAYAGWDSREAVGWLAVEGELRRVARGTSPALSRSKPPEVPPERAPRTSPTTATPATKSRAPLSAGPAKKPRGWLAFSREKPVDDWVGTAAFGVGGGWRSESFDGSRAAEPELTLALAGRVALVPRWSGAWALAPSAGGASLDPSGSGIIMDIPMRFGFRYGAQSRRFAPELGIDAVLRLTPADNGITAGGGLAACAGVSGASRKASAAVRLEACLSGESDAVRAGLHLFVESRLGPG